MKQPLNVVLLDEAPRGQNLERLLAEAGCNLVATLGYSLRVVEYLREQRYDLLVVAVREPLVRSLRAVEFAALLSSERPVVAFLDRTKASFFPMAREVMRAGAWDMFAQPMKPGELFDLLWRAIALGERRRLARRAGMDQVIPPGHITVIFGGRGGTGKTTLALNLSFGHATLTDERVLLADLDPQRGGSLALLNPQSIHQIAPLSLSSFLDEELCDALERYPLYTFGPLTMLRLHDEQEDAPSLIQAEGISLVDNLSLFYDHIYVDTPAYWSPQVETSLRSATLALFPVLPDVGYLVSGKSVLELAREATFFTDKVKVVVNQADMPNALSREAVEDALGLPVIWEIPRDPAVARAAQLGVPIVESLPQSKAGQSLLGLLYTIAGARRPPQSGPWARLWGRFRHGNSPELGSGRLENRETAQERR